MQTGQGTLATHITSIFAIPCTFTGTLASKMASLRLDAVIDDLNGDLLDPWADLQEAAGIQPGPIGPYVEKELLKDTDLSLDGGLFERETGFVYAHERVTEEGVRGVVESYRRMGWWP